MQFNEGTMFKLKYFCKKEIQHPISFCIFNKKLRWVFCLLATHTYSHTFSFTQRMKKELLNWRLILCTYKIYTNIYSKAVRQSHKNADNSKAFTQRSTKEKQRLKIFYNFRKKGKVVFVPYSLAHFLFYVIFFKT